MNDTKSCANCKFLSEAKPVTFDGCDIVETRVLCIKKLWHRGSIEFGTIYEHPKTFRDRADSCKSYQPKTSSESRIMRDV